MGFRNIPVILLVLAFVCFPDNPAQGRDDAAQLRLMSEAIKEAGSKVRYQAEQTVYSFSRDKTMVSRFRIKSNYPFRKKERIDGPEQNRSILLEDGQHLWSFFPARKIVVKEPLRQGDSQAPADLAGNLDLLLKNYEVKIWGPVPAAGVQYRIMEFHPTSHDRPHREMWIEEGSKLLVRVNLSSQDGRPLYKSELDRIQRDPRFEPDAFRLRVPRDTRVYEIKKRENLTLEEAQKIVQRRIILPKAVPQGFMPFNIVLRTEALKRCVQVIYSDGLSSFSVFQQWPTSEPSPRTQRVAEDRGKPVSMPLEGTRASPLPRTYRYGLMNVVTMGHGGRMTIFVGDIDEGILQGVASSVENRTPPP